MIEVLAVTLLSIAGFCILEGIRFLPPRRDGGNCEGLFVDSLPPAHLVELLQGPNLALFFLRFL